MLYFQIWIFFLIRNKRRINLMHPYNDNNIQDKFELMLLIFKLKSLFVHPFLASILLRRDYKFKIFLI